MTFVFGTTMETLGITSDEGDDTSVVDATAGFQSCASATQEVKQDEKQIKFLKNSIPADMSSVTFRICVQSIMTAGTNTLYAYIDGNSITTNDHIESGTLSAGDNDITITQNFLDEILTTHFTLRIISEFGSKNKMGSLSIQYTVTLLDIVGVTKDDDDNIDDEMGLVLFQGTGSVPMDWVDILHTTSATTTGAYTLGYEDNVPGAVYRVFGEISDGTESDITPRVTGV